MAYREDRHILEFSFQPTLVGLTAWYSQLVATFLLTLLITLAVWRSRRTLLNQVEAEVVRADLARYFSPDVAEAPARHGETALRLPISRIDSQDGSIGGGCRSVRRKKALAIPLMMKRHKLTAEPTERHHVRRNSLGDQNLWGFFCCHSFNSSTARPGNGVH